MARIRSLKHTFFSDEKLAEYPPVVRLTFAGLIAHADDEGRLKGDPRLIKAQIWPLDDDVTSATVAEHLRMLADGEGRRIEWYEVKGRQYIQIRKFKDHQYIQKPRPSDLPAPSPDSTVPVGLPEGYRPDRSGVEGNGMDRERSGAEGEDIPFDLDPLDLESASAPPAPRVTLPAKASAFLERFYGLPSVTKKRRTDVAGQLYDTLDPDKPGARLRRGVRVKARDADHLAACCAAVMADPPRQADSAIVILLQKLQDIPHGQSPPEQVAKAHEASVELEERYRAAMRSAALRWAHDHPDEFKQLRKPIDAEFADVVGSSFGKMAHAAALEQITARAAQFPQFDEWQNPTRRAATPKPHAQEAHADTS